MNQPPVKDGPPMNHDIRAPRVLLIDQNGEKQGVMPTSAALEAAEEAGMDLVQIVSTSEPPVCKIDTHDYEVKAKAMHRFFDEGDKVKVTLRFRGREMAHPELGMKLLNKVQADFEDIAKVEYAPRMEGRQMIMILAPK
jgi:translation initiation factor IF-3